MTNEVKKLIAIHLESIQASTSSTIIILDYF